MANADIAPLPEEIPLAARAVVQMARGPEVWVEGLGLKVPTYTEARPDLLDLRKQKLSTLMHHVPMNMRGPYKIAYGRTEGPYGEKLGIAGYAMCMGTVPANARKNRGQDAKDRECRAKAVNRSGYCNMHGGMLHPLDRSRIDWEKMPREYRFKYGKLSVEDLDDEELSRGQIRRADGTFTTHGFVSQEIHDKMVRKLFERADEKLRENLLDTVEVMVGIAKSDAVEPADRIKAATWVHERVRGKVSTEIKITQEKPFEVVMEAVYQGGSRTESRAARGLDDGPDELDNVVDAEFFEELDREDVELADSIGEDEPLTEEELLHNELVAEQNEKQFYPATPEHRPGLREAPAQDPELRAEEEKSKQQEIQDFRNKISQARAKRYKAREQGFTSVQPEPYGMELEDWPEIGANVTKVFWTEPKVKTNKARDKKEQRRSRRDDYG